MTDAQQIQKALDAALYPMGVTTHEGKVKASAGARHYVTYDVERRHVVWANNQPIIEEIDVTVRYYTTVPPVRDVHIDLLIRAMRGIGYMEDGGPYAIPALEPTDCEGVWLKFSNTEVVSRGG